MICASCAYGAGTGGWTTWGLAAGLSAYLLVGPRVDQYWAWRGLTAGMMVASMAALSRLQGRANSAMFAVTLSLVAASMALVALVTLFRARRLYQEVMARWLGRERWPGLQAPQHTVLYSRETLERFVAKAGLEVVDYLPYGAYPAYFYLFAGAAFKILKGRGLNLSKAIYPYFLGQLLLAPFLLFERRLNLAMQTIVCRRRS